METHWQNASCYSFHFMKRYPYKSKNPKCPWAKASSCSWSLLVLEFKDNRKFDGSPIIQNLSMWEWGQFYVPRFLVFDFYHVDARTSQSFFSHHAYCLLFCFSVKLHFSLIHQPLHHFKELLTALDGVACVLLMVLTVAYLLALSLSFSFLFSSQPSNLDQGLEYQSHRHIVIFDIPLNSRFLATFHCIHLWSLMIW